MLNEFFQRENIEYFSELSFSDLSVLDEKKMARLKETMGTVESAVFFLIPYSVGQKTTNLSVYAQVRDYHLYARELSLRFGEFLKEKKLSLAYHLAADSSPVDERLAAAMAGLGVKGENGLLLNERYGSLMFIGEIFLSKSQDPQAPKEIGNCISCGKCRAACPTGAVADRTREKCLSHISQKKRRTAEEDDLLAEAECKWGCDLCQNICPYNKNAKETPISFFREGLVQFLSEEVIHSPKAEFETRAFSWRGREILKKNIGK
ncbi:MAG: epoxyqueuosine reductase [Clostridia bacterium]|nr:epoxyqueuosine reductase [Clostridia bacterium]